MSYQQAIVGGSTFWSALYKMANSQMHGTKQKVNEPHILQLEGLGKPYKLRHRGPAGSSGHLKIVLHFRL